MKKHIPFKNKQFMAKVVTWRKFSKSTLKNVNIFTERIILNESKQ